MKREEVWRNLRTYTAGGKLRDLVVVIEDDEAQRKNLVYLLEAEHVPVLSACDGLAGLSLIKHQLPRIVVVDVYLPHISGLEICAKLRADPLLKDIFVIAMTAMGEDVQDLESMRREAGANMLFPKPLNDEMLLATIRGTLSWRRHDGLRGRVERT